MISQLKKAGYIYYYSEKLTNNFNPTMMPNIIIIVVNYTCTDDICHPAFLGVNFVCVTYASQGSCVIQGVGLRKLFYSSVFLKIPIILSKTHLF